MDVKLRKIERAPSLKEKAYQNIKHIILHDLSGDSPLIVDELANQLGISRTQVREALLALESEGLVNTEPNKGTFVTVPCVEEIRKIYQVRSALESLAVKLATPLIPDAELQKLKVAFESAQQGIEAGDYAAYLRCDAEFHRLTVGYSGNEILGQLIENLEDRIFRVRVHARKKSTHHLILAHREHGAVLEALLERNADKAELEMKKHLEKAAKRVETIIVAGDIAG